MRRRRAFKRAETQAPRGYCGLCRNQRRVMGTTVYKGVTHPAMVPCPECVGNPAAQLKLQIDNLPASPSTPAPIDAQQRAAGERRD